MADYAAVGITHGLYWVVDARYDPVGQKAAIRTAFPNGDFGKLGLWLDIEKPRISMTDAEYRSLPFAYYRPVESVWRGVQSYTGVYPGWYTNLGSWSLILSGMPISLQDEVAEKALLWTAQYNSSISSPELYGGWLRNGRWCFWQYREGPDYNWFNGDRSLFESTFNIDSTTPPTNGGNGMAVIGKGRVLSSSGVKVRDGAATSFAVIGSLSSGALFDVAARVADVNGVANSFWLQIANGTYAGKWCAEIYQGAKLCEYTPVVVPPPTGPTKTHDIDVFSDGKISIDGNAPF